MVNRSIQLTKETVEIHYVEGNHLTILEADVCATAINGDPIKDGASFVNRDKS